MTETGRVSAPTRPDLRVLVDALPPRRKRQLALLTLLTLASAAADVFLVTTGLSFVTSLAGQPAAPMPEWLGNGLAAEGVGRAALLFAIAAVTANLLRLAQLRWIEAYVAIVTHELTVDVQRRLLAQPFSYHALHHSSEALGALDKVAIVATQLIQQWLQAIGAIATGLSVAALLISIDPLPALAAIAALALFYWLVARLASRRLQTNSAVAGETYDLRVRKVQEGMASIRDIKLDHLERAWLEDFRPADARYARARASTGFIAAAPRHLIEAGAAVLVAALAAWLAAAGRDSALALVGGLAIGGLRALPLLQQAYRGWAVLTANRMITAQVADLLRLPAPDEEEWDVRPLPFTSTLRLDGLGFSYPGRVEPALAEVSLTIARGERIGLAGETGSGKSTLIDLIMGLLAPATGQILVDGKPLGPGERRAWQRNIAHVAQSVVLTDDSIARNIAFSAGGPPDMERVQRAAEAACIADFVATLPAGFETRVGERGVQLSGGQRQRIAIARALYKNAPLLVLDEATNALDEATEARVLANLLADPGKTILIVAHRPATLRLCDRIVTMSAGRIAAA